MAGRGVNVGEAGSRARGEGGGDAHGEGWNGRDGLLPVIAPAAPVKSATHGISDAGGARRKHEGERAFVGSGARPRVHGELTYFAFEHGKCIEEMMSCTLW